MDRHHPALGCPLKQYTQYSIDGTGYSSWAFQGINSVSQASDPFGVSMTLNLGFVVMNKNHSPQETKLVFPM